MDMEHFILWKFIEISEIVRNAKEVWTFILRHWTGHFVQ